MANKVFLMVGSNINKELNIREANRLLHAMTEVLSVSPVYETPAMGPTGQLDQPSYYNVAYQINTDDDIDTVNQTICKAIEKKLHRVREEDRCAARTIDIDIVLFNDDIINNDNWQIPAPDIINYAYCCIPLAAIAPNYKHPKTQQTLAAIAEKIDGQDKVCLSQCHL